MISLNINPNILSQLQQDSDATKEIATLLKEELTKYSKQRWKKDRIKIQKDLLQCLLPTLLEIITEEEKFLKYLDLSEASFTGINIRDKIFKNSNANIDPQTIKDKSLCNTYLKGLDLSHTNFNGVNILFANLEDTGAQIDPQLIKDKSLFCTNVKGCTFINQSSPDSIKREPADFTGVDISYANLEKTGAIINPHTVRDKNICGTKLDYCTLIDDGKLIGINYDKDTSLKHVKFAALEPHNIYQDITEYIQTTCSPKRNKVFKKNKRYPKQKGEDL